MNEYQIIKFQQTFFYLRRFQYRGFTKDYLAYLIRPTHQFTVTERKFSLVTHHSGFAKHAHLKRCKSQQFFICKLQEYQSIFHHFFTLLFGMSPFEIFFCFTYTNYSHQNTKNQNLAMHLALQFAVHSTRYNEFKSAIIRLLKSCLFIQQ